MENFNNSITSNVTLYKKLKVSIIWHIHWKKSDLFWIIIEHNIFFLFVCKKGITNILTQLEVREYYDYKQTTTTKKKNCNSVFKVHFQFLIFEIHLLRVKKIVVCRSVRFQFSFAYVNSIRFTFFNF